MPKSVKHTIELDFKARITTFKTDEAIEFTQTY
jgi:hypothetical protein